MNTADAPPPATLSAHPTSSSRAAPASSTSAEAASFGSVALPPLASETPFAALPVPKFRDAVVVIPAGAREPRPVVIALHGNYDRPEWQCETWSPLLEGDAFVLCPRGIPRADAPRGADRWTYRSSRATFAELSAARDALVGKYSRYIESRPPVLFAFSLGAIHAAREIVEQPASFPNVALIEGGYDKWSPKAVQRYAEGGGERVLFACAQTVCRNAATKVVPLFEKYGAEARVGYAANAGHTYDGDVAELVREHLEWLLQSSAPDE